MNDGLCDSKTSRNVNIWESLNTSDGWKKKERKQGIRPPHFGVALLRLLGPIEQNTESCVWRFTDTGRMNGWTEQAPLHLRAFINTISSYLMIATQYAIRYGWTEMDGWIASLSWIYPRAYYFSFSRKLGVRIAGSLGLIGILFFFREIGRERSEVGEVGG